MFSDQSIVLLGMHGIKAAELLSLGDADSASTLINWNFIFSAIPSVAFAMMFAVPRRYLPFVALGGAYAFLLRSELMRHANFDVVVASFWATLAVSFAFIAVSRIFRAPRLMFTVASVIPLIPGKFAYLALMSLMQIPTAGDMRLDYVVGFVEYSSQTLMVLSALALGVVLPPILFYRSRPVV